MTHELRTIPVDLGPTSPDVQQAMLLAQLEATIDAILILDLHDRVVVHNDRFERLFDLEPGWARGRAAAEVLPRVLACLEDAAAFLAGVERLRADPRAIVRDEARLRNGRAVERYGVCVRGADGATHGRLWTFRDITPRKVQEARLAAALSEVELQRARLDQLVRSVPGVVWESWGDTDAARPRPGFVSEHVETMLGHTPEEWLSTPDFWLSLVHPDDRERAARETNAQFESGEGGTVQFRWRRKDGTYRWAQSWNALIKDETGRHVGMRGVTMDLTSTKAAEEALAWQGRVLEKIALGAPLEETLATLCRDAETFAPGRRYSVLLASPDGRTLRGGSAPSLPGEYNAALEGLAIGPDVGSCGTAAFTRRPVFTQNIATDPRWDAYRALALPHGLRACWSTPILGSRGDLLGTWAVYRDEPGLPTAQDEQTIAAATRLAAIAIERSASAETLRLAEERLRLLSRATSDIIRDWDLRTDALWWNENFQGAFGDEASEVQPTIESWTSRVHPEDLREVRASLHAAVVGRVDTWQASYRFRRKDGQYASILDRGSIIRDGSGAAVRFVGSMMDVTELTRTHEDLQRVTQQLEQILASAGEGILGLDADGRTTFINPAAAKVLGYAPEEVIGRPRHVLLHHTHADGRRYALDECPVRATCADGETRKVAGEVFWRKDGTAVPVEYVSAPIREADRILGAVVVFTDVTHRRQAERALVESQAALTRAQEIAHLGTWTWDIAADVVEWSDELCRIHGVEAGLRTSFDELVARAHPDDRETLGSMCERALAGPLDAPVRYRVVRPTGEVRHVQSRAEVVLDAHGRPARLMGTCLDVTYRSRAEETSARLAAIVESSEDAIYAKSLDGRITEWNPGAERLYGYSRDEILEKPIQTVVPPDRIAEETQILERVTRGESLPPFETVRLRKDGSRLDVSLTVSPIRDGGGRLVGASTIARDITERRRAEHQLSMRAEELARLTQALQRSNRELDQFAYIASHDLKAPLRGIANLSSWIEEDAGGALGQEAREHLDLLRGRVQRMESLIDAILEYSRVGRVKAQPEPVDVRALLADVIDLLSPPEGFRVETQGAMPTVVAERARLHQVFLNLVANAIKHHHDKARGLVTITAEDAGAHWRFTVKDNGPGIAPRFHEKVFVIFQTLEARDRVEGTGIGLALVKKIVESGGGTIALDSDGGRGAAFTFTWRKG